MTRRDTHIFNPIRSGVLALILLSSATGALAQDALSRSVQDVEARIGGRIGYAMSDLHSGQTWGYRADDRFPVSSTFKALLCGVILARVDAGEEALDRLVTFGAGDLVTYSPVTETRLATGMTVGELCKSAVTISDNTAGNLLLATVDGPEGFTAALRDIGDTTTRLDRWETALNEGAPGDMKDTTTPQAALSTLRALLFGEVLTPTSRRQLADWMIADAVADDLLRASLPEAWVIGDKSGAGGHGSRSIIAVIWPTPDRPVLAAIYMTENDADMPARNAAIAEIGAAMFAELRAR
ncbi:beta-lactamase class A [Roseovarius lutimaris]|uniref:Beta-lactamase n=1 Tax=Roseovarius lutimaris TaxID=1005928 RepID=A0A1I5B8S4_9RHOB|nr:class A beta-lactamase [Roseovarius lutimaris]SFN71112.1 beta-lactamase class A [Roseovarius lutimaris]